MYLKKTEKNISKLKQNGKPKREEHWLIDLYAWHFKQQNDDSCIFTSRLACTTALIV